MNRNLLPSPNRDSVQGALPLEPAKSSFNGLALLQERLSFKCVLDTVLRQKLLVSLRWAVPPATSDEPNEGAGLSLRRLW